METYALILFKQRSTRLLIHLKGLQEPDFVSLTLLVLSESSSIATRHSFSNLVLPRDKIFIGSKSNIYKILTERGISAKK